MANWLTNMPIEDDVDIVYQTLQETIDTIMTEIKRKSKTKKAPIHHGRTKKLA